MGFTDWSTLRVLYFFICHLSMYSFIWVNGRRRRRGYICLLVYLSIYLFAQINIGHARKPAYGRRRTDVLLPPLASVQGPNLWFVKGYDV